MKKTKELADKDVMRELLSCIFKKSACNSFDFNESSAIHKCYAAKEEYGITAEVTFTYDIKLNRM